MFDLNKYPWERLPDEPNKQYQAFCKYRDMGINRSILKVAKEWSEGGHASKLKEWSSKYHWVERAASYDEHIDKIKRDNYEDIVQETIRETVARHTMESKLFQTKVHERLETIDPDELKPNELIKWYETAVKIERLSLGIPTENIKREEIKEVERDAITPEKLKNEKVRKTANQFIKTIAGSQSSAHGIGTDSK